MPHLQDVHKLNGEIEGQPHNTGVMEDKNTMIM